MIVVRVEPRRLLLDSDCWWDVGVPEVSERPETQGARGGARARQGAPARAHAVRIVATAEVPAVARRAFAPLGRDRRAGGVADEPLTPRS